MKALLFPGQGSQKKGMGKELFEKYPEITEKCSEILGYSIKELCLQDPKKRLRQTEFSQPAIFFVNALNFIDQYKSISAFDFVLGHSLGEYNALFAAGAFDILTGVTIVKKRGELMAKARAGTMLAILGKTKEEIMHLLKKAECNDIDIANENTPKQFVLSGLKESIERLSPFFEKEGVKAIPLNVSGAFHSRYMKETEVAFREFVKGIDILPLQIPVIANRSAKPHQESTLKRDLSEQITHPVKWVGSIEYVLNQGCEEFEEVGGDLLQKMVLQIRSDFTPGPAKGKSTPKTEKNDLGSKSFQDELGVDYPYVAGAMYRGIASEYLVLKMANAGFLSFFGSGGLSLSRIEESIHQIKANLKKGAKFGVNLLANYLEPEENRKMVKILLKNQVDIIEASAFVNTTPEIALFSIKGMYRDQKTGEVFNKHKIFAKVSKPETAAALMKPPSKEIIHSLLQNNEITEEEALLARERPVSNFICLEADSGGHTDRKNLTTLLPAVFKIRNELQNHYSKNCRIYIGAAGGLGTPNALAMAFFLKADFVVTGSINQCSVESGTSDRVKDLLQQMDIPDTDYAPAGDMFEIGSKVQVLKKGVLFPIRANKLYFAYSLFQSIDQIPPDLRKMIENTYFRKSFEEVFEDTLEYFQRLNQPSEIERIHKDPKYKMAVIFRWYLGMSNGWAIHGDPDRVVDYQIHTGPALGAYNQWVKGTHFSDWKNRHVDEIGKHLIEETKDLINPKVFINAL